MEVKRSRGKLKYPEITHLYVACHDGGFDSNKGMGADVTDISAIQLAAVRERIVKNQFTARTAPVNGMPEDANGRILVKPVEGISGEDAILLQPGLWMSDLTSDHYGSPVYQQYLFQNLADMFQYSQIPCSTHVKVYLSLGINIMHKEFAGFLYELLMHNQNPFHIQLHNGKEWFVTFGNIEIKEQPFWILADQLMRWDTTTGALNPPDLSKLQNGYYVVLDCGSNTFQGLCFVKNMIPINPFCEGIGVWDVLKRQFKQAVMKKACESGVTIDDPKMQQLMEAYKTGLYQMGKRKPLDLRQEKEEMNRQKVEQRLATTKLYLQTGKSVHDMVFAGGDADVNIPRFREYYEQNITGEITFAIDDNDEKELIFRLASGGLKGAIRRWSGEMQRQGQ